MKTNETAFWRVVYALFLTSQLVLILFYGPFCEWVYSQIGAFPTDTLTRYFLPFFAGAIFFLDRVFSKRCEPPLLRGCYYIAILAVLVLWHFNVLPIAPPLANPWYAQVISCFFGGYYLISMADVSREMLDRLKDGGS